MRILYLCLDRGIPLGGVKGASVHVEELLRAFEQEGHDTEVIARGAAAGSEREATIVETPRGSTWIPDRILRRDMRELRAARPLAAAVRQAVRSFRPDLVYERYALFREEGREEARRAGVPYALEVNAPLVAEERRFRGLRLHRRALDVERRLWRTADLVVVPSHGLAEIVRAPRMLVLPNAVDAERFSPRGRRAEMRATLGLDGEFVVGFAGSAKPWHDFVTLVRALRELEAVLLLIGDASAVDTAGVRTVTTGPVPHAEVGAYLEAADVCFAGLTADPSLQYFSPLKALEYLAAGRATVVADAGSLSELVRAGVAAPYTPGDAPSLVHVLRVLAADATERERLAAAGRSYAQDRSWRAVAREVVQAAASVRETAASA